VVLKFMNSHDINVNKNEYSLLIILQLYSILKGINATEPRHGIFPTT
jgi:hypothetical protein